MPLKLTDRPITAAQIRQVHAQRRRAGMDDDLYRETLQNRYGVESCKQLTRKQASVFIAALGRPMPKQKTRTKKPKPKTVAAQEENVTALASMAQRKLIDSLVNEVSWAQLNGYDAWRKINLGIRRVATAKQASNVIEGLKGLKAKQVLQRD